MQKTAADTEVQPGLAGSTFRRNNGVWVFVSLAALVTLCLLVARHQLFPKGSSGGALGSSAAQIATLEDRLGAMERRQQEQFNQLQAAIRARGQAPQDVAASRRVQEDRVRSQEHARRVERDPVYALTEQKRELETLRSKFAQDSVNPKWASETRAHLDDAIISAAAASGVQLKAGNIDCRSTRCMIKLNVGAGSSYEDLITPLMIDLATVLPRAELVVFPSKNGIREVNILASAPTAGDGR